MLNDEQILLKTANLLDTLQEKCWDGYKQVGMKKKSGKNVPNCVPVEEKLLREIDETEFEAIEDVLDDMKGEDLAFNKLFDGKMRLVIDFPTLDIESELGKFAKFFRDQDYEVDWNKGMVYAERETRKDVLDLLNIGRNEPSEKKIKKIQMKIGKLFPKIAQTASKLDELFQIIKKKGEGRAWWNNATQPGQVVGNVVMDQLSDEQQKSWKRLMDQMYYYIPAPGIFPPNWDQTIEYLQNMSKYWQQNAGYIKDEINNLDNDKYSIIITRHPIDVMRMSDFEKISSCHSPPSRGGGSQEYYKCAVAEAMGHGAIAYVVQTEHLLHDTNTGNIDSAEQEIQEGELFHDDARNRDSGYLTPVSRARLRQMRYYDTDEPKRWDDGTELAVPEERIYGAAIPGIADRVREWARENQKQALRDMPSTNDDNEDVNLDRFFIFGGSYEDTAGPQGRANLLARLSMIEASAMTGEIRQNTETEDELDANALSGLAGRWRAEVEEIMEEWNNRYANTHVDAEVQEDYEGGFYIGVRATMQWKWDINEFSKLPNSYPTGMHAFDSINDIWGDVFDTDDGFINKDDNKNVRIGCTINLEHPEVWGESSYVYDPEGLRAMCVELDVKMDDRRDAFQATLEEFLKREGWMVGGEYLNLAMEIEDGQLTSYEWDLDTDGGYSESYESYASHSFEYDPQELGISYEVLLKILESRDFRLLLRANLLAAPRAEVGTEYHLDIAHYAVAPSGQEAVVQIQFKVTSDDPDERVQLFKDLIEGEMDDEDNLKVVFNRTMAQAINSRQPSSMQTSESLVKMWKGL